MTAESNEPVKRQNFETTDMITNNSEGRLLIQWKRIVTDNAASTDIDLEMLKKKESKSISVLLQTKNDLLHGNVPSFRGSSANNEYGEKIKVVLDNPKIGISAVKGHLELLNQLDLKSHPALKRVEVDSKIKLLGSVDTPSSQGIIQTTVILLFYLFFATYVRKLYFQVSEQHLNLTNASIQKITKGKSANFYQYL